MKLSKDELYQRYGIRKLLYLNPFIYAVLIMVIFAIDFLTSKLFFDLMFSDTDEYMNLLVTASVCVVIDVVPIVLSDVLADVTGKVGRRISLSLMLSGFAVVLVSVIILGFIRIQNVDLLFGNDPDSFVASEQTGAPFQSFVAVLLTLINIATTIFGILMTLHRAKVQRQIDHAKNCEALADYKAAIIELAKPDNSLETLEAEYASISAEIDRIAEEGKVKASLEIALLIDPRAVTRATHKKEKEEVTS
jgi:hypothetical protein